MGVYETESPTKERTGFDHASNFIRMRDPYLWEQFEVGEGFVALGQTAKS